MLCFKRLIKGAKIIQGIRSIIPGGAIDIYISSFNIVGESRVSPALRISTVRTMTFFWLKYFTIYLNSAIQRGRARGRKN